MDQNTSANIISGNKTDRSRTKASSLPPTPSLKDPELRALIKKYPIVPSMAELAEKSKQFLSQTRSKVQAVIKKWVEYELDDEVDFNSKYQYRLFLERYYQDKFKEIIEIGSFVS